MTPEEREEIQADWLRRSKDKLVMTEADVNWTPMSYPTKDLMLFEELTEDKMAIIDAYGLIIPFVFTGKRLDIHQRKRGNENELPGYYYSRNRLKCMHTISQQLGLI